MIALIDGDMVSFRCAASAEGESEAFIARARVDSFIDEILAAIGCSEYEVWLSGDNNFRYNVYPEYKANRVGGYRPKWESETLDHLKTVHNAQTIQGAEADDALGYRAYEIGPNAVVVTNDKDLKMIEGTHYDPVKKLLWTISPEEANRWFYYQCLIGDPTDNIKGVPGIGPKNAERILSSCQTEEEMLQAVMNEYSCEEEFLMNAQCLWIFRKEGDVYKLDGGT
jgi:5'-3' exonuclease